MRRLEHDVEVVVLSHGHFDHTTGIDGLIRTRGKANVPVLIHPEFWSRRRLAFPGRDPLMLPTTSRSALEGAGFEINEQHQPSLLRRVAAGPPARSTAPRASSAALRSIRPAMTGSGNLTR
jgi:7,8-dihydropterin-6-yl-methyl-4-(beta-D-ribofuranosyl)aminobenzene 5'-phosphate synthase